ncbi:MAG: phosphotransferase family protein [Steroidobacteraceae bacterium]
MKADERPPLAELTARLTQLVKRVDSRLNHAERIERVSAGATLETWSFDAVGAERCVPLIMRRAAGARAIGTLSLPVEAQVLQVVARSGVPVPEVWQVLSPEDELGEGFLMRRIDGWTIPQKILRSPELAEIRPSLVDRYGAILAAIHGVPRTDCPSLPVVNASSHLQRVEQQYRAQTTVRPVFELALRWLHDHPPPAGEPTLVHGDYRNGNFIIGGDGVRAVLDWEGAHIGDPAEDLAWLCLPPWRFGELDRAAGGLGSREALLRAYESASQRVIEPARLKWWEVFGSLRWGVTCADMTEWVRSGRDRTIERAMIARRASESELDLLRVLAPR